VFYPDIKLSVHILPTGQYNVVDFLDPSINLFFVTAQCIDCPEEGIDYRLEVKLNFNDINPAIWGVTFERTLIPGMIDLLTDSDFSNTQSIFSSYFENEDFIAQLEETYYLPAGNVELSVKAYEACPFSPTWMDDFNVDCNLITSDDSHNYLSFFNNVVSELVLLSPVNNEDVSDSYPWFRWESPGFMVGVQVDYQLFVYQFDPVYHSTYADVIEDENSLYFSTKITEIETGLAQQIQVQYPVDSDKDLTNGYTYVWHVEAQDVIQDPPFNGDEGIWGWPEPILSHLYTFDYDGQNCKIIHPDDYGYCEMVLGWGWTGETCELISGCGTGDDAPWFYDDKETCVGRCSFMNLSTETVELPHEYTLSSYPNPFNPTTTIFFSIPEFGFTTITVYDITGIELETLTNEILIIGNYSINWNANDHSSGVYLIKMDSGDFTQTQKVTLVK